MDKFVSKSFTILIICFPILQQYKSPISGVPLADFMAILYIPFLLGKFKLKISKVWYSYIFCIFLLFYTLIFVVLGSQLNININASNIFIGVTRLSFHFFLIFFGVNSLFNFTDAIKMYKLLGIVATIYLIFQYIAFHIFGVILPWVLPFLQVYQEGYNSIDFSSFFVDFYRPYSFFLEPGFYVQFLLPLLVIFLFSKKYRDIKAAIFLSLGIVLSTSGQGLLITPLIWAGFIFLKYKKNFGKLILGIMASLLVIFAFKDTVIISRSLGRLFGGENASSYLRMIQPIQMFNSLPTLNQVIGIGYNNIEAIFGATYLNSSGFLLISIGFAGTFIYSLYLFVLLINLKSIPSRIILLVFMILLFVSGIVTSGSTVFYFCILISLDIENFNKERIPNEIIYKSFDF